MKFSEHPPSRQWATLKYKGVKFADVWFKPNGDSAVTFRIPADSFHLSGVGHELTIENLLLAIALAPEEVESWQHGGVVHAGAMESNTWRTPLSLPPDAAHLEIIVRVKPLSPEADSHGEEYSLEHWQDLDARWKAILSIEATLDSLRINCEGVLAEIEASLKKTLTIEEKLHARRADVSNWNKAKNRAHHTLPRLKEFIHRAVWALGAPERKQLDEIHKTHIEPQIPFPHMDRIFAQLESLQKDRQILSAHGVTVGNECKGVSTEVNNALRTLQSNAAADANKKDSAARGGKFFKQVRRWSGAE